MKHSYIAKRFQSSGAGLSLDTEALAKYKDIIDLSIGDTDFTTDESIINAAFRDAKAGHTHYGDPKGDPELIDAVCRAWEEDFGQRLPRDHVLVSASSCLGMALVMLAILDPGDEVIVFSPYFPMYREQIELAGGVCVDVPTYASEDYAIDEARLRAAITPRTKAIVFNNPTNPTGMGYDSRTLELLARVAQEHDLLIAADEIYTTYLYEGDFRPIRTLPGMAERTITLNSFSKNFLMTGWRVGVIIAEPELLAVMNRINGSLIYSAPSVSQRAAHAGARHAKGDSGEICHCLPRPHLLRRRSHRKDPLPESGAAEGHVLPLPRRGENGTGRKGLLQGPARSGPCSRQSRHTLRRERRGPLPHRLHRRHRPAQSRV